MLTRTILTILITLTLVLNAGVSAPALPSTFSTLKPAQVFPAEFEVNFYPVAPYHVGDVLSIRVTYTGAKEIGGSEIELALANEPGNILETATFSQHSRQAVFYWVLDTTNHIPGLITFIFSIPETGDTWTAGVNLLSTPPGRDAAWSSVNTTCCTIHYITGTDAESDILSIQEILEAQTAEAYAQFASQINPSHDPLDEPLSLVLIPIVVGHGGFATDTAVLTYSRRNWAGINFTNLAHHEIVHVIDRQLNDQGPRPALFSEGIAVYLSGGHYRDADPLQRAAAIYKSGLYIPIVDITDDFYAAQHEISYMEAAGLVAYLSKIWGWETFLEFYFNLQEGDSDTEIISAALEHQYDMDLASLEADFIHYISTLNPDAQVKNDVRLTIETYDMIRRYQTLAIPSAHFQTAWWPPVNPMLEQGRIGDYAFREKAPFNVILETLFLEIHMGLDKKDYARVEETLAKIDQHLDNAISRNSTPSHYAIGWPLPNLPGLPFRP